MKTKLKKLLSLLLAVILCAGMIPAQAFAAGGVPVRLPETEVEAEILASDVFYLATPSAQLAEGDGEAYLLRVARGGDAQSAASVRVRIADVTAKYGEDYIVRAYATGASAANPRDNRSLMELMMGSPYTQSVLGTEEELTALLEDDTEGQTVLNEGIRSAVGFLDASSGLSAKYPDGYPAEELDEVQRARADFTGTEGRSQRLITQSDGFQDLQSVADVLTTAVVGAELTLDFAPGEALQYLELIPKDNHKGDGDRLFYLVLTSPEGSTTVSKADACAVTIADDEEQTPAAVSFSAAEYAHVPGEETVTVTVERSGAMNTMVSVILRTTGEGSAVAGRDYSEVERSLMFPFGVASLTVDIPVRTEAFTGSADFGLRLEAETGCTVELDRASVTLTGTYEPMLLLAAAPEEGGAPTDVNSLSTVKLLDPIDLSRPASSGHQDNYYGGNNHFEKDKQRWLLEWMDSTCLRDRKGTVGAVWQLTKDEGRYWIAGAQVVWERTGSCAEITVDIDGRAFLDSYFTNWKARGDNNGAFDLYKSTANFGKQTVNLYPTEQSIREYYSYSPKWIGFYNRGRCDDCNRLWIYSIQPILRPFQIVRTDAAPLDFLQADGSYLPDDGTATKAVIVDSGNTLVCFVDDSFTVAQPSGSNVQQYAALKKLNLVNDSGETIYTLGANADAAAKEITYTLSRENLTALKQSVGTKAFQDMIRKNTFAAGISYGYPNYAEMKVQPVFGYIDSAVTLHNPYDFPVEMDISGTTYALEAHETQKLTFHLGDRLALTEVRAGGLLGSGYTAVGAVTKLRRSGAEAKEEEIALRFVDGGALYLGGSNTGDHRLCCRELTVEPNLQENGNRIIVRVRTGELNGFDRTERAGLLHGDGVVNGEYTEFLMADAEHTVNGKLYAVTALPANSGSVCVWNDRVSDRSYEGSTFYFTAGASAERNVITLSLAPARKNVTLEGTLYYMSYNLHDRDAGGASALPASGAVVAAGSASAAAGDDGFFRTGEIPVSGSADRYLRYLVSVNGNALVQETAIPTAGGTLDVSGNFPNGVSPVNSEIFNRMQITAAYPAGSGYSVADSTYLPIVSGLTASMRVLLPSVTYSAALTGENGMTEQTLTEHPTAVTLTVYDANGHFKGEYEAAAFEQYLDVYAVTVPVDFATDAEEGGGFAVLPGDKLYLRLTTDRLAQAGADGGDYAYTYSDIYTGFTFIEPTAFEAPVAQTLDNPVDIAYPDLPLLGTIGMSLDFPYVTVGWMKIAKGYRMYIGVSAAQIYDKVKGSQYTSFMGDDGMDWGSIFQLKHPFESFAKGIREAYGEVTELAELGSDTVGSLGSPQWKFDLQLGAYFDFYYATASDGTEDKSSACCFAGVGFYMSASLGFKVAWYFVIPVVFIPAYIGVELSGTVMGFLGAAASADAAITKDAARKTSVDFDSSLDEFTGSVRGIGIAQLNVGVGLCGTLGIRAVGTVKVIGEYAPSDIVDDFGAYIEVNAGITVDLFLLHIPLEFTLAAKTFGSFAEYEKGVHQPLLAASPDRSGAAGGSDPFTLRTGSGRSSVWRGSDPPLQSALTPASSQVLVTNAYERADAQLITLADGTVVLAFIDSDPDKGDYQRTTLKLATCRDGVWSEPVSVCADDTADFQPSICETKDGRVLAAWVSTGDAYDISADTSTVDYLSSMEVYAAFATVNADGSVTVDTPTQLTTGTSEHYYDANPTVVCDRVSGDAIVYYIKSGSTTENAAELANPYTNDSVVCYMYYNAEADDDGGKAIPAGWLTEDYYASEYSGKAPDAAQWGGQRFLRGPVFRDTGDKTVYYAIPDFTAIGYNGLAVFAYTVDTDGVNDTDSDKELYLQVFNFAQHELKYRIRLTDDGVSDALPQFFRARNSGLSTAEENTHTKLFWYRGGNVCYLDVTRLIQEGIADDGSIRPHEEDYTDEAGILHRHYTEPNGVGSGEVGSMADFRVAEDENGSLYLVWTEGVTDADGVSTRQLFAMGMYTAPNEDEALATGSSGWSKPRQLTAGSYSCDEPAVTACGEGLMVVHNRYRETLNLQGTAERFEGVVDYEPIVITQTQLSATVLEPCGAVETEDIRLTDAGGDGELAVLLPEGGKEAELCVTVRNNGLTDAAGYRLTLYAVQNGEETEIGSREIGGALMPTGAETQSFAYTLPENVEGLYFRAVTQEKRSAGGYYADRDIYETAPLECRAAYAVSNVSAFQTAEGFRLRYTLTNNGNAAGENDALRLSLNGPFNLELQFDKAERLLYTGDVGALAIGESRDYDVTVTVPAKLLEKYGFVDAAAAVIHTAPDGTETQRSESAAVQLTLTAPLELALADVNLAVGEARTPRVSMALAERFGGSDVIYAVEDPTVATLRNGQLVGLEPGTTTLYATHPASGAVTSADVTVVKRSAPVYSGGGSAAAQSVRLEGSNVSASATVSGGTATLKDIPAEEIGKVGDGEVQLRFAGVADAVTAVALPTSTVKTVSESAASGLSVALRSGTVVFDAAAVDAISEAAAGREILLTVKAVDGQSLSAAQKEALRGMEDAVVLRAELVSGGETISDFGGGSARVTIPYVRQDAAKDVAVYYLDAAGVLREVECVYDAENGTVTFTAPHFSEYAITEVAALPFADVAAEAYYADAVRWAYRSRVTVGTDETHFSPDDAISRAQAVTFLWRAAGCPAAETADSFADVAADAYYAGAVAWAMERGIAKGTGEAAFDPDAVCTRSQIVTFLARFAGVADTDTESGFSDVAATDYFAAAVGWARGCGVAAGTSETAFSPNASCTRAQAVTFLYRWMVR